MPDHKTVSEIHMMIDRLTDWWKHNINPNGYAAPSMTLTEMSEMLTKIAKDHESRKGETA